MRSDEDFMVFVAARWPSLVRRLVGLGCPVGDAHEVAAEALSRCRRRWAAVSRDGDVEALVGEELDDAWARYRRTHPRGIKDDGTDEPEVLAPPTLEDLRDHDRRRRAALTRRSLAVLVPVLLVVAGLTWWTLHGDDTQPPDADALPNTVVERVENPLPTVWYADGTLHLAHVTVEVEDGVLDLSALGTGAVYGDTEGRVIQVGDDGSRSVLGAKPPGEPLVASDENGWAAWVDTGGESRRIVVYRADRGQLVGELPTDPGTDSGPQLIAVDGDTVYYRDDLGSYAWKPQGDTVVPVTPADLVDVRSRITAYQQDPATIQVVQSFFNVAYSLPGTGARLAPDGNTVVTRLDQSGFGRLTVYDTRSGEEVPNRLGATDVALAVSLGERQTATYVVGRVEDMRTTGPFLRSFAGGDLELRSCDLGDGACTTPVRIPDATDVPVLAR